MFHGHTTWLAKACHSYLLGVVAIVEVDEDPFVEEPTLLKALLRVRHWQKRKIPIERLRLSQLRTTQQPR